MLTYTDSMLNDYNSAFPISGYQSSPGYFVPPIQGVTQRQYAEIHLMAGLLSNFEFIAGKSEHEIAERAKAIVSACILKLA